MWVNFRDYDAFAFRGVHKIFAFQENANVTRICRWFKKDEIPCSKLISVYECPLFYLRFRSTRQLCIENIFVNRPHKARAIYSALTRSTQSVPGATPPHIFAVNELFRFTRIRISFGSCRSFSFNSACRLQRRMCSTRYCKKDYGRYGKQ